MEIKSWLKNIGVGTVKNGCDYFESCICSLDNWVNQTNLDQKWNIWHFNEGNITFYTLNDAP